MLQFYLIKDNPDIIPCNLEGWWETTPWVQSSQLLTREYDGFCIIWVTDIVCVFYCSNATILPFLKGPCRPKRYLKVVCYTALDTDHCFIGIFSTMQQILRKKWFCKVFGNSVTRKEKLVVQKRKWDLISKKFAECFFFSIFFVF